MTSSIGSETTSLAPSLHEYVEQNGQCSSLAPRNISEPDPVLQGAVITFTSVRIKTLCLPTMSGSPLGYQNPLSLTATDIKSFVCSWSKKG